jgi:hypothetical protein
MVLDEMDLNAESGFHKSSNSAGDVSDSRWEKGVQHDEGQAEGEHVEKNPTSLLCFRCKNPGLFAKYCWLGW